MEQGLIGSVDDYVLDYFPNYKIKRSYAAIGNSGNVIYINPQKELVVAVSGYFKPTVFDRIEFIKEQIEAKLKH